MAVALKGAKMGGGGDDVGERCKYEARWRPVAAY